MAVFHLYIKLGLSVSYQNNFSLFLHEFSIFYGKLRICFSPFPRFIQEMLKNVKIESEK